MKARDQYERLPDPELHRPRRKRDGHRGKLTFLPGAEVEGLEALLPSAQLPQLPAQADSVATTIAALKDDFNALLSKLRAAGLMESADAGGDEA